MQNREKNTEAQERKRAQRNKRRATIAKRTKTPTASKSRKAKPIKILTLQQQASKSRRQKLMELSNLAKKAVDAGKYPTVNAALIDFYKIQEGMETDFYTLKQWSKKGYQVRKGSKSFTVWGKPKQKTEAEKKDTQYPNRDFYPMAYLFSTNQVTKRQPKKL